MNQFSVLNKLSVLTHAVANDAPNGKRSREVDALNVDSEQPAPGKKVKTTVTKSKHQHEVDDPPTVEQVTTTKKPRTEKAAKVSEPQALARRSERAHAMTLAAPPKRKRRTKAEMAADKAKADEEKKRLEDIAQENHRARVQMDIAEDIDRAETATRTIRTFGDLEDDSGEEFVGLADIEDSELDDEAADALTLKVSFPNRKKASKVLTSPNRKPTMRFKKNSKPSKHS